MKTQKHCSLPWPRCVIKTAQVCRLHETPSEDSVCEEIQFMLGPWEKKTCSSQSRVLVTDHSFKVKQNIFVVEEGGLAQWNTFNQNSSKFHLNLFKITFYLETDQSIFHLIIINTVLKTLAKSERF